MRNWLAFSLLMALWTVLVTILLFTHESPNSHGVLHAQFPEMDQGGAGLERHGSVLVLGWILGSLVIAVFVGLLAYGARQRERKPAKTWAFVFGGLLFEGVFAMMCLAYRDSLHSAEIAFIGPFPAGTWWLLFGIWLIPFYFIGLYVVFFDRWIMDPRDLENFERLVAEKRQEREGRERWESRAP